MKKTKEIIDLDKLREEAILQASSSYVHWKDEHEGYSYQRLEEKRSQELFWLVTSGLLRKAPMPTGREVKERALVVNEDSLEVDTKIPENLDVLCTQLSPFVYWVGQKKEVLLIDYEKIEKYFKRYPLSFKSADYFNFYFFDVMLDLIQDDMAKLKPQIAKYLKNYEHSLLEQAKKDCIVLVNACQSLLKPGIRQDILGDVIRKLMDDQHIGEEAQTKLCSIKTRNKYICELVAALDCFGIFKPEVNRRILAKALSEKMDSVSVSSAEYYIKMLQGAKDNKLFSWVKENINDLKAHAYHPLLVLTGGIVK